MKCKECIYLAEDKDLFDKPWCLCSDKTIYNKNQTCIYDIKEVINK